MPVKPPNTIPEFFSELLRAFGIIGDVNHEWGITSAQYERKIPPDITATQINQPKHRGFWCWDGFRKLF